MVKGGLLFSLSSETNLTHMLNRLRFLAFIILLASCSASTENNGIAYTIPDNDLIPEGIAYDAERKEFYISSTYKRKIIKLREDGSYEDFIKEQQDGIYGVLGMRVDTKRRILWAASGTAGKDMPAKGEDSTMTGNSGVFKYDLNTGKLIKKYMLPKDSVMYFLNDLVVADDGTVYITETRNGDIYTIAPSKDELELFYSLPEPAFANGIDITPDQQHLYVAWYSAPRDKFGRLNIHTRKLDTIAIPSEWMTGADGLYFYNNSLVVVMPDPEHSTDEIVQYKLDTSMVKISERNMLAKDDTLFSQPTTGVVVGNKLYYIASSNLQLFRRLYEKGNGKVDPAELAPVRIGVKELK